MGTNSPGRQWCGLWSTVTSRRKRSACPHDRQMRVPSGSSPPARRASGPDASRPPVFSSPAQTNSVPEQLMQMGATRMSPTS